MILRAPAAWRVSRVVLRGLVSHEWRVWVVIGAAMPLSGCLAYHVVATPVKLVGTTAVVAGETAGAVVKTTGKLTVSAVNAVGRVGSSGIEATSRLAEAGMITFVDVGTGTVVRVPWRQGMTLAEATANARLQLASKAVDVVRAGAVVYSASRNKAVQPLPLSSGDVVRISH